MRAHSGILLTFKVAQVFTTYDFYAVCTVCTVFGHIVLFIGLRESRLRWHQSLQIFKGTVAPV
jgi:hypothetical protein